MPWSYSESENMKLFAKKLRRVVWPLHSNFLLNPLPPHLFNGLPPDFETIFQRQTVCSFFVEETLFKTDQLNMKCKHVFSPLYILQFSSYGGLRTLQVFQLFSFFCKKTKNIYYIELIDVQMYISKFFYKKKKKNGALQLLKLGSFISLLLNAQLPKVNSNQPMKNI